MIISNPKLYLSSCISMIHRESIEIEIKIYIYIYIYIYIMIKM